MADNSACTDQIQLDALDLKTRLLFNLSQGRREDVLAIVNVTAWTCPQAVVPSLSRQYLRPADNTNGYYFC